MQTFHHFVISRRDKCHDDNKYTIIQRMHLLLSQRKNKSLWFAYDLRFQFKQYTIRIQAFSQIPVIYMSFL